MTSGSTNNCCSSILTQWRSALLQTHLTTWAVDTLICPPGSTKDFIGSKDEFIVSIPFSSHLTSSSFKSGILSSGSLSGSQASDEPIVNKRSCISLNELVVLS